MSVNLLDNGGFEIGSTHDTHDGSFHDNIEAPAGWVVWWDKGTHYHQPEAKVFTADIDPVRVRSGSHSWLCFTFFGRQHAGLYQIVRGLEPGATYRLQAFAHAWSSHQYALDAGGPHCSVGVGCDPVWIAQEDVPPLNGNPVNDAIGNFTFTVGVGLDDPDPFSAGILWGAGASSYNGYTRGVPPVEFMAPESGAVVVYLRALSLFMFKNSDAYWDDAQLVRINDVPPEPEPEPARQYARTVHLLPQNASLLELAEVVEDAAPKLQTITWSVDDTFIRAPELTKRTAHVWAADRIAGGKAELLDWVEQYYPPTPDIIFHEFDGVEPPEPEPEPPAPQRKTRGHLGLHLQTFVPGWEEFARVVRPPILKMAGGEMQAMVAFKVASPDTTAIWRYVHNDYGDTLENPDPHEGARNWIAKFGDSLYEVAGALHTLGLEEPYFYVESINEVYPSHNAAMVNRSVEFDMAFIDELEELNLPIAPVVFTAGVGNPHESEYALLIPLARRCEAAGGLMGYHAYNHVLEGNCDFDADWPYYAGRYQEIDKVFEAVGITVRWCATEAGDYESVHCGWRHERCWGGDWDKYLESLITQDELDRQWNREHGDRFLGRVLFTSGIGTGWPWFQITQAEMQDIAGEILAYYG